MAWAAGGSLRNKLRTPGDREIGSPLAWLPALLSAVADVHRHGLVHGDLKPANVLFDASGNPWLNDFALARPFGDPATAGSAGYVSPERLAGSPCDARDDVFAIGRMLEELISASATLAPLGSLAAACTGVLASRPLNAGAVLAAFERGTGATR
jgi:serine/threonine-protein kinase